MKYISHIAAGLLALIFVTFSAMFFLGKMPSPPKPPPADVMTFMSVFMPTGYLAFVKFFELIGGILVAVPKTRNWGLLVLGPIILNILAFNALVAKDAFNPVNIVIALLALYLLWDARRKFAGLLN